MGGHEFWDLVDCLAVLACEICSCPHGYLHLTEGEAQLKEVVYDSQWKIFLNLQYTGCRIHSGDMVMRKASHTTFEALSWYLK